MAEILLRVAGFQNKIIISELNTSQPRSHHLNGFGSLEWDMKNAQKQCLNGGLLAVTVRWLVVMEMRENSVLRGCPIIKHTKHITLWMMKSLSSVNSVHCACATFDTR